MSSQEVSQSETPRTLRVSVGVGCSSRVGPQEPRTNDIKVAFEYDAIGRQILRSSGMLRMTELASRLRFLPSLLSLVLLPAAVHAAEPVRLIAHRGGVVNDLIIENNRSAIEEA